MGCTSSSPPFSLERRGISVVISIFFCLTRILHKDKKRALEKLFVYGLCVCRVGDWGVVIFSAGLQGEVCGSDIRQHAKLRGHPQQWNWRQTN